MKRGFTLIELLVVVSIIALLSSILVVALKSAQLNAQDSVIISELDEFKNLYEIGYNPANGYGALQPTLPAAGCNQYSGSIGYYCTAVNTGACSTLFASGSMQNSQALDLCNKIVINAGAFYMGVAKSNPTAYYSLAAYLPFKKMYKCVGSGGNNSLNATVNYGTGSTGDSGPGCSDNP